MAQTGRLAEAFNDAWHWQVISEIAGMIGGRGLAGPLHWFRTVTVFPVRVACPVQERPSGRRHGD